LNRAPSCEDVIMREIQVQGGQGTSKAGGTLENARP
jgi:hypothetical protein